MYAAAEISDEDIKVPESPKVEGGISSIFEESSNSVSEDKKRMSLLDRSTQATGLEPKSIAFGEDERSTYSTRKVVVSETDAAKKNNSRKRQRKLERKDKQRNNNKVSKLYYFISNFELSSCTVDFLQLVVLPSVTLAHIAGYALFLPTIYFRILIFF